MAFRVFVMVFVTAMAALLVLFFSNLFLLMMLHGYWSWLNGYWRWLTTPVALGLAGAVWRYAWIHSPDLPRGMFAAAFLGAVLVGGIGFIGGFFSPILLDPGANQGPLLGIFFTGPLGFVVGAIGGAAVYWWFRHDRTTPPEQ